MIKVLIVGENCKDRFIYCETTRFSPEAPVPVLTPIEKVENNGMSGNVARNMIAINNDLLIRVGKKKYIVNMTDYILFYKTPSKLRFKESLLQMLENDFQVIK